MREWIGQIHCGDALETLRRMPSESVQCVVTSPPYWGLRDYGTGVWVGGDESCTHVQRRTNGAATSTLSGVGPANNHAFEPFRGGTCGKCGARREDKQMGLEVSPEAYLSVMVGVFGEVRRVLRKDGVLWLNMGDSYQSSNSTQVAQTKDFGSSREGVERRPPRADGLKPKDLVGMPWRLALALRADGWWLRSDVIWHKPNPMPESVTDRPTRAHEYVFLMTKAARYYYDADAVKQPGAQDTQARYERGRGANPKNANGGPGNQTIATSLEHMARRDKQRGHSRRHAGFNDRWDAMTHDEQCAAPRNLRDVWTIATQANSDLHFATFPEKLVEPCILAGTSEYGACAQCGAPWARVTDTSYDTKGRTTNGPRSRANRAITAGFAQRLEKMVTTTGWRPTCRCECVDVVPCVVLDPFAGTGTALRVAQRLGRQWVGIELNPEYIGIAMPRLAQEMLL